MNFQHIVGQVLGVLLMRVFIETGNRHFWVRTPNIQSRGRCCTIHRTVMAQYLWLTAQRSAHGILPPVAYVLCCTQLILGVDGRQWYTLVCVSGQSDVRPKPSVKSGTRESVGESRMSA